MNETVKNQITILLTDYTKDNVYDDVITYLYRASQFFNFNELEEFLLPIFCYFQNESVYNDIKCDNLVEFIKFINNNR